MNAQNETPLAESISLVLAGVTNAGKSSLLNNLFQKEIAVVSDVAGTTTDPVTRKIELQKLGACSITDTAGLDDTGILAAERISKTRERILNANIVLFVTPCNKALVQCEKDLYKFLIEKKIPFIVVFSFSDKKVDEAKKAFFEKDICVYINNIKRCTEVTNDVASSLLNKTGSDITILLEKIESMAVNVSYELTPVEGIVKNGETVVLVTPIDTAAPAGRLILPQVETIRDLLDRDCKALVVKENALADLYENLKTPPALVITDSQAFAKVKEEIPETQKLTSFSILFARKKGGLEGIKYYVQSLKILNHFPKDGKVLVMEACSHHRQDDDIGTVKIPCIFAKKVAPDAKFFHSRQMPQNPKDYDLIIHCAACMVTSCTMNERINVLKKAEVPVINYGLFLAWANGLLPRALEPIPEFKALFEPISG